MVARLQAANAGKEPVLLRTSTTSGHGIGSALDEIIAQRVDLYAFLIPASSAPPIGDRGRSATVALKNKIPTTAPPPLTHSPFGSLGGRWRSRRQ